MRYFFAAFVGLVGLSSTLVVQLHRAQTPPTVVVHDTVVVADVPRCLGAIKWAMWEGTYRVLPDSHTGVRDTETVSHVFLPYDVMTRARLDSIWQAQ
jgi:hypothetical protein